jgi:hypothetical protein
MRTFLSLAVLAGIVLTSSAWRGEAVPSQPAPQGDLEAQVRRFLGCVISDTPVANTLTLESLWLYRIFQGGAGDASRPILRPAWASQPGAQIYRLLHFLDEGFIMRLSGNLHCSV